MADVPRPGPAGGSSRTRRSRMNCSGVATIRVDDPSKARASQQVPSERTETYTTHRRLAFRSSRHTTRKGGDCSDQGGIHQTNGRTVHRLESLRSTSSRQPSNLRPFLEEVLRACQLRGTRQSRHSRIIRLSRRISITIFRDEQTLRTNNPQPFPNEVVRPAFALDMRLPRLPNLPAMCGCSTEQRWPSSPQIL